MPPVSDFGFFRKVSPCTRDLGYHIRGFGPEEDWVHGNLAAGAASVIVENGGKPNLSRVGHAFIKAQMREKDALFAGELSGHYYFKENSFAESSALAVLFIANLVSQSAKPLSALVAPIQRYFASGEINSTVADAPAVLRKLRAKYADAAILELDGLSFEYPTWWFNVRSSNTEPLVRLNLEAKTKPEMAARRDEVLALIRG